jgi:hypothetical protein
MARKFYAILNFFLRFSHLRNRNNRFDALVRGSGGVVLVLVLGDPDVSDRITEQNNFEAIGLFSL